MALTQTNQTPSKRWTTKKALVLSVACLVVGIGGGWSIRGLQGPATTGPAKTAAAPVSQAPSPARLKEMADAQAAPLLEKLKADQANPDLLTSVGNLYYDAHQYPTAIDYYGRALKVRPSDASVRTDMGTAYWYMGNADAALAEFDKALTFAPTNASTLFNRGLVRFQGKKDSAGAIDDWEKLLAANPTYQGKSQVEQMMAEARKQPPVRTGINSK
jgi:tetratricopeptide (TPR) repeat protein